MVASPLVIEPSPLCTPGSASAHPLALASMLYIIVISIQVVPRDAKVGDMVQQVTPQKYQLSFIVQNRLDYVCAQRSMSNMAGLFYSAKLTRGQVQSMAVDGFTKLEPLFNL